MRSLLESKRLPSLRTITAWRTRLTRDFQAHVPELCRLRAQNEAVQRLHVHTDHNESVADYFSSDGYE